VYVQQKIHLFRIKAAQPPSPPSQIRIHVFVFTFSSIKSSTCQ
jgi:hypothetical protein